jgi:hypothetical protein
MYWEGGYFVVSFLCTLSHKYVISRFRVLILEVAFYFYKKLSLLKTKLLLSFFALTLFMSARKKEKEENQSLPGMWLGQYTIEEVPEQGALPYYLYLKPDGSLTTEGLGGNGKTYVAMGTWSLQGSTLTLNYETVDDYGDPIASTSTFTFENGTLNDGSWKNTERPFLTGSHINFNKVQ